MKKSINLCLGVVFLLILASLCSCNHFSCQHEQVTRHDSQTAPTCTEAGIRTIIEECNDCGEKIGTTWHYGPSAKGHRFENNKCKYCNFEVSFSEGLYFTLSSDGTYAIVSGLGECLDTEYLVIPTEYRHKPVKEIADSAFENCSSIKNVVIPGSIDRIGNNAFGDCDSLESANISAGVEDIGDGAFSGCTSLKNIVIPDTLTSVGDVSGFVGAENIHISNIDKWFELGIDYSYGGVPNNIFHLYLNDVPVTHIDIPKSVTKISRGAIANCISIESVTIHGNVTEIEESAFAGCQALKEITIPNGVTSIGDKAFEWCQSLTSIVIPDGVTSIGNNAFAACYSINSITIPDSVTFIGEGNFLSTEYFNNQNNWQEGLLYIGNHLIATSPDVWGRCTIKDGTRTIAVDAFSDCQSITNLVIPISMTNIEYSIFKDITSLTDIYYCGSEDEWNNISVYSVPESITVHYNYVPEN